MTVKYHKGKFPPASLDWKRLIPLIGPANAALARFDGVLAAIPNALILLSPLSTQEAVLSSKIEGTQATMGVVLEYEAEGDPSLFSPEKTADIQEIINYRSALMGAAKRLDKLPLSQRLFRDAHACLLEGVRGHNKTPGEYRRGPNWIGRPGNQVDEARFVPIDVQDLPAGMSTWEKYIHAKELDNLVQLAVLHAEFESLHPFLDGNGRLGRMLIPLFLFQRTILSAPVFYMSAYLEAQRDEYYDRLLAVSRDDDWTGWCIFFLNGIEQQAVENTKKAKTIIELHHREINRLGDLTRSHKSAKAVDFFFNRPIFRAADFVSQSKIPKPTASRFLKVFRDKGVLKVVKEGTGRRSSVLAFGELINIAEGRKIM
jgi:Fic family protein